MVLLRQRPPWLILFTSVEVKKIREGDHWLHVHDRVIVCNPLINVGFQTLRRKFK